MTCSLTDRQFEHLMQNGVPGSLIDALLDAARRPAPPPAAPWLPAATTLSADEHFPVR